MGLGNFGIEANGHVVILEGSLILAQVAVGYAPVYVGKGVFWVETDGCVIVLDGTLVLT